MLKTLLSQVGEYKKATIITPIFTMCEVILEILIPLIMASIIDEGIEAGNINHVYMYGAIMLAAAMLSLLFGILAGQFAAKASAGFAANLRKSMYHNVQKFSFSNIDKYSTGGLITRMTTDVTNVQNAFQMILRMSIRSPFMLVCAFVACVSIDKRLSAVMIVAIIFLVIALGTLIYFTMSIFRKVFEKYDAFNTNIQENISAIRVVKAYVREDYENSKFVNAATALYELFIKAESNIALNMPIMMFAIYGSILGISWFGAHFIAEGTLATGQLAAALSYVMNIMIALMLLSMIFVMLTMSAASAERIVEVLNENSDITNPEGPVTKVADGSIDFEKVCFAYTKDANKDTLSGINLHINSGETIGIIGGTGSGKSTLISLISRLYDVKSGSVKVGGIDVRKYDLDSLRNNVAVVLQKNVLFSGTILDNLRWGKEDATEEECIRVCKLACADDFIEKFPDKYETKIEQGGTNVSGGQRQRLCIARALLKEPKVLILDDSTSAVDTATDASIREAFKKEIPNTTKIIVAQRISSVEYADRIIVIDDGKVVDFDTPENLLKNCDIYREVYESQKNGEGDFDSAAGGDK